jgi:hypothetical protein
MASGSLVPERKQRIAFRVVTGAASARNVVASCAETSHKAFNTISGCANKVNRLAICDAFVF